MPENMKLTMSRIRPNFKKFIVSRYVFYRAWSWGLLQRTFRSYPRNHFYREFWECSKLAGKNTYEQKKSFFQWLILYHLTGLVPEEYFILGGLNTSFLSKYNSVSRWRQLFFQDRVNQSKHRHLLDNKSEFNRHFNKLIVRDWRDTHSEDLEHFMSQTNNVIIKPQDGKCGQGIRVIDWQNLTSSERQEIICQVKENEEYIVEEILQQRGFLHDVNKSSVNTLRVNTLLTNDGAECIAAFFRTGRAGEFVDNMHAGGILWHLDNNTGEILFGVDAKGGLYQSHPDSKITMQGDYIPRYHEAVNICLNAHKNLPQLPQIGWDVVISDDYIALIEGNASSGFHNIDSSGRVWNKMKNFFFQQGAYEN